MQAVGVTSDKTIPSDRLSATSSRSGFEPEKGRLHGDGAWSPSNKNNRLEFLQIDLHYDFFICAVATQGHPSNDFWTTKYKLLFSVNVIDWLTYKEKGKEKVCIAITTSLNPRYSYQTNMILCKNSWYFMIRLHSQAFFDKVKAPFNNAVIHRCRACNIPINTAGHDTNKDFLGGEMCFGKLNFP